MPRHEPVPRDVETAPLPARLRWWADRIQARSGEERFAARKPLVAHPLAQALLEAAGEVELGQRTRLTFLGKDGE